LNFCHTFFSRKKYEEIDFVKFYVKSNLLYIKLYLSEIVKKKHTPDILERVNLSLPAPLREGKVCFGIKVCRLTYLAHYNLRQYNFLNYLCYFGVREDSASIKTARASIIE